MMTLDEAIKHAEDKALGCEEGAKVLEEQHMPLNAEKYRKCAEEHKQLAKWLKELKELRGEANG